jgi:hypothetical protein
MAKDTALQLFQGEDRQFIFTILNSTETAAIDIAGWTLSWMVKRYRSDTDVTALVSKTTVSGIVISGVYNSVPATNTQVATVTVDDTDTIAVAGGLYSYELKRMDNGFETVLAFGSFNLEQGVIR